MERTSLNNRSRNLLTGHYKDLALLHSNLSCNVRDVVKDLKEVNALLVRRQSRGRDLIKLGLACLAFPEPVVSNSVGCVLLTLGYTMERAKKRGLYVTDIVEAVKELKQFLHRDVKL